MRTSSVRAIATLGAAIALTIAIRDARAQGGAAAPDTDVALAPDPPFDKWCLAPFCVGDPMRRPALVKVPAIIAPTSSDGYLEQKTKQALVDAVESAAKATLGPNYNEAVADVAEAIAATVTTNSDRLDKVGGLGAAIVRGALAYHVERFIARDPGCVAPRRYDAIYEGLATSIALAPLKYRDQGKARGRVNAACVETAKRTARTVDQAVLRKVVPDDLRAQVEAAMKAIDDAKTRCASLPAATEDTLAQVKQAAEVMRAATVDAASRALAAFLAVPPPAPRPPPSLDQVDPSAAQAAVPSPAELACTKAIATLRTLKAAPFETLARQGLSNAQVAPLLDAMRTAPDETLATVVRIGTGAMGADEIGALVRELIESLVKSAGLPTDAPVLKDAIAALPKAIVVTGDSATIDPNAILAFLASQYGLDDEGKPSLRSVLGLGVTPWVFELNGGIPQVDFSQQKIVGDVTIGYATKKFGVVGRGWLDTYNIDDALTHNDYTHAGGALESWWLSGDGTSKLRLELRLSGAFDYYDTTTYPFKDALKQFYDFDSRMVRGTGFVGVRYGAPNDRFSLQLLAGGGAQFEDPDTTKFTSGNTFSLTSQQNLTAQGAGRLRVRVRIVPQIVGIRLRADSTYFRITREQLTATSSAGTLTTATSVEQQEQIEFHGRFFLDADVASFGGFVPAVFAGLDYIGTSGSATSTSAAIPLLGVGIVRQTW